MLSRTVSFTLVRPFLRQVLYTQAFCLILSGLLLDGGSGFRICLAAVLAHWLAIAFVSARSDKEATTFDSFVVQWGFFPCLIVAMVAGNIIAS